MQTHDRVVSEAQRSRWEGDPPQTMTGGSPPTVPPHQTLVLNSSPAPEPKRPLLHTLSLYGCLLQLVALFAALWVITGVIAVIAILS